MKRVTFDEAFRVVSLGCHQTQLIESLGYDFQSKISKYWREKSEGFLQETARRIREEFSGVHFADIESRNKIDGAIPWGVIVSDRGEYAGHAGRDFHLNSGRHIKEGEFLEEVFTGVRLALHMNFDRKDNMGYRWSSGTISAIFNRHGVSSSFGDKFDVHRIFRDSWSRGELGIELIPEALKLALKGIKKRENPFVIDAVLYDFAKDGYDFSG